MEYHQYILSFIELIVFVLAVCFVAGYSYKTRPTKTIVRRSIKVTNLNQLNNKYKDELSLSTLNKEEKKHYKKFSDQKKVETSVRVFVLRYSTAEFESEREIREKITALLQILRNGDEVYLELESNDRTLNRSGLIASQLLRLKQFRVNITVFIDYEVLISGYMIAVVADFICAAPFAKLCKVDFEPISEKEFNQMFDFIQSYRPTLDYNFSDEPVTGLRGLGEGLIDEVATSDAYVERACMVKNVYLVEFA